MEPIYNYNQDPQFNDSLWHKIGKKFKNMKPVYRVVIFC